MFWPFYWLAVSHALSKRSAAPVDNRRFTKEQLEEFQAFQVPEGLSQVDQELAILMEAERILSS